MAELLDGEDVSEYTDEYVEELAFKGAGYVKCKHCMVWKDRVLDFSPRQSAPWYHSWCKQCMNSKHREYSATHPAKRKATVKASRDRIVEHGFTASQKSLLKSRFGITIEEKLEMFNRQNGLCAVTGLPLGDKFDLDHDDKTKVNRGLVLHKINLGMGLFDHNSDWLRAAADYLDRAKK